MRTLEFSCTWSSPRRRSGVGGRRRMRAARIPPRHQMGLDPVGEPNEIRSCRRRSSFGLGLDAIALAQRLCLLGTTERRERIGSDAGGVLGPGMLATECLLVAGKRGLAERKSLAGVAGGDQQCREIAPRAICDAMLGAERLLVAR